MPMASTSIGTLPNACVASVWNSTPFSLRSPRSRGWAGSCDLVVGEHDRDQDCVAANGLRSSSRSIRPCLFTLRNVISKPCCSRYLHGRSRLVFGDLRDDVPALVAVHVAVPFPRCCRSRWPRGPDDLLGGRADGGAACSRPSPPLLPFPPKRWLRLAAFPNFSRSRGAWLPARAGPPASLRYCPDKLRASQVKSPEADAQPVATFPGHPPRAIRSPASASAS